MFQFSFLFVRETCILRSIGSDMVKKKLTNTSNLVLITLLKVLHVKDTTDRRSTNSVVAFVSACLSFSEEDLRRSKFVSMKFLYEKQKHNFTGNTNEIAMEGWKEWGIVQHSIFQHQLYRLWNEHRAHLLPVTWFVLHIKIKGTESIKTGWCTCVFRVKSKNIAAAVRTKIKGELRH